MASSSSKSSIENMTAADSGAFDCGVCECPLKPPIFQCEVGHMVCSECKEKMAAAETCHVCRCTLAGGYKRCFGAEHIVECLKVPCPNKGHGCQVVLTRYDLSAHLQVCKYPPFHCPAEHCAFSDEYLLVLRLHFEGTHKWPSTTVYDGTLSLVLLDGFNVFQPFACTMDHLLLLKVTRESYGRVVTPIHVRRRGVTEKYRLKLAYETPCGTHRLEYALNVPSTHLSASGGLPSLENHFDFIVPKSAQQLDMDTIKVDFTCWCISDLPSKKKRKRFGPLPRPMSSGDPLTVSLVRQD